MTAAYKTGDYQLTVSKTSVGPFNRSRSRLYRGLQGMPGEYVPQTGPMGMSMAPSYNPTHQMTPHPSQLRHGHPLHPYLPGPHHPHHPAMLMHGGPPSHPGITMSAESPPPC